LYNLKTSEAANVSEENFLCRLIGHLGLRFKRDGVHFDKKWNDCLYSVDQDYLLHFLAGWMDTDGGLCNNHLVLTQKRECLVKGVERVCWILEY
jgi:hypothetical protein